MRHLVAFMALIVLLAACGQEEDTSSPADEQPTADAAADGAADDIAEPDAGDTPTADVSTGGSAPCNYPFPEGFDIGQVVPEIAWEAFDGEGNPVTLDLVEFYCGTSGLTGYNTVHFIVTTGWCPNCPNFITYVDSLAAQIEAAGGLVFYLTVEDESSGSATSDYAHQHVSAYAPNGSGIRAGDGSGTPLDQVRASPTIEFFPTSFSVRLSDMKVIADQRFTEFYLPFVEISEQPELDWSNPGAPTVQPEVPSNCDETDEEPCEPNDRPENACTVRAETIDGGICNTAPDHYFVDIDGPWSAFLDFSHDVGDLDIYVWDLEGQRELLDPGGMPVGSETTDDGEYFEYEGPANVIVVGYHGATAPYRLTFTEL